LHPPPLHPPGGGAVEDYSLIVRWNAISLGSLAAGAGQALILF
jgi:hypothetical protein